MKKQRKWSLEEEWIPHAILGLTYGVDKTGVYLIVKQGKRDGRSWLPVTT